MTEIALSFSKINNYDICPRQFKLIYLDKSYPKDDDNPYFVKGNKLHKQLEDYVVAKLAKDKSMIPRLSIASKNVIPIVEALMAKFPDYYPEQKICVDKNFKKLTWFSRSAYFRAIIDFLAKNQTEAILVDYKSGKVRPYDGFGGQLHLSAFLLMKMFPDLKKATSAYLYLEHKQTVPITITRDDLPALEKHFSDKYWEIANDTEYEPKRNQYCSYCKATPTQCKFKTRREL